VVLRAPEAGRLAACALASLLATAPIAPVLAALIAIAVYVDRPLWVDLSAWSVHPLVAGTLDIAVAWAGLALLHLGLGLHRPEQVNGSNYDLLHIRCDALDSHPRPDLRSLDTADPRSAALADFDSELRAVKSGLRQLGPAWVTGLGYLNLWRRIHRAEAMWDLLAPVQIVVSEAYEAQASLKGARIESGAELSRQVSTALEDLEKVLASPAAELPARISVARVWTTIQRYRDDRWERLLKSRNRLLILQLLCASLVYALVWVAITARAEPGVLLSAAGVYLFGAVIGLFARLYNQSRMSSSIDDYGLSLARHLVTPQVCGIAAVGGLVIYSALTSSAGIDLAVTLDVLGDTHRLVTAAVFAVAPGLLLERLNARGDAIKDELNSTKAGEVATPAY
jgi:hypothetical protein